MSRRFECFRAFSFSFEKISALSVAAIALVGCSLLLTSCGKPSAPMSAAPGGGPIEVGVVAVTAQTVVLSNELPGRTLASAIAEIRPQVSGIIQKRLFEEGGTVKAGERLYQIDPAIYQASYDSALAALAKADANLTAARLKSSRYQELLADKAVSAQAADDAHAALGQAIADVAAATAALSSAKINLGYTGVASPIAGQVGKSSVTQGALVSANQSGVLATVQQIDPIQIDVTQSSRELLALKKAFEDGRIERTKNGAVKVHLRLEDGSMYGQEGVIAFSEAVVDSGTGTVTLRAIFPNPKHDLLPGMYVRALVDQGTLAGSILVPQQGVTHDAKGNAVAMIVDADGKVASRILKIDRAIGNQWLVADGLVVGDQLIVEGLQKARPGTPVTAVAAGLNSAGSDAKSAPTAATEKK